MEGGIYVTWDTIIKGASILGALGVIIGLIIKCVHWFDAQKQQSADIEKLEQKHDSDFNAIQEELGMLTSGVLACLKGLHEKGCNGPVTAEITKLEAYINKKAHSQESA